MNILKIYKDSLSYPSKDIDKLLTLGVLFFLDGIISLFPSITIALNQTLLTQIFYFISNILGFIIAFIAIGYAFSIVKNTIVNSTMPLINLIKNFTDGIKIFIISIIYYTIPLSITLIIAYFAGILNGLIELSLIYLNYGPEATYHMYHLTSITFNIENMVIIVFISALLFILTTLFLIIAIARFADTNIIKSSFNFKEIINNINNISWRKYLTLIVIFIIILLVILIVTIVISIIPFVGLIIFFLFLLPFITIFLGRTVGLIYMEGKDFI